MHRLGIADRPTGLGSLLLTLASLLAVAPVAGATPIRFEFEGTTTGTLDGRPFGSTAFQITANADTGDIVHLTNIYEQELYSLYAPGTVAVAGIGDGRILDTTRVASFPQMPVPVVGLVMGPHEGGGDLLILTDEAFAGYSLNNDFGPVTDARGDELLVQTDFGPLLLFVDSVAFRATIVPEPHGFALAGLIAAMTMLRHYRRIRVAGPD